jgi:hypothetical protein
MCHLVESDKNCSQNKPEIQKILTETSIIQMRKKIENFIETCNCHFYC